MAKYNHVPPENSYSTTVRRILTGYYNSATGEFKPTTDVDPLPVTMDGVSFTGDINVAAFQDINGTATDAYVFTSGADISSITPHYQVIAGLDYANDKVQALNIDSNGDLNIQSGVIAESSQTSAVTVGTTVTPVSNLNKEQVIAGHSWATNSNRSEEINPLSQQYVVEAFTLSNVPNATPDETIIINMNGFSKCSIHVEKTGGTDTFAWTMESSVEGSDSTNDFIDTTQYGFTSATAANAASYTADGIIYSNPDFVPTSHKVKITTAGGSDDADFNVFVKKLY